MSFLANEIDVRSLFHGQVSLTAVDQIYVIHEAMYGCKNLKTHLRLALKMCIFKDVPLFFMRKINLTN